MRKYTDDQERAIRVKRLVDSWTRSGLLDGAQQARISGELPVDLRRTNQFLRATLFGFGLLMASAAVALVAVTLEVNDDRASGVLCLVAAALFIWLAETLIGRFHLYRFGVEEACAASAAVLIAIGSGLLFWRSSWSTFPDSQAFVALIAGSFAAFAVYRRYGYIYAAVAAMMCAGFAPFWLAVSDTQRRLLAAAVLSGCFVAGRIKRRIHGDEYPGDEYAVIQASAWLLVYAVLNLHLDLGVLARPVAPPSAFRWFTYAMIWILPAAGLWWSIRDRDRLLLDASLVMAMATLVTNKPYLGLERKPWDPILLGLLLIGAAIALRRWLAAGPDGSRRGLTPSPLLRGDKDSIGVVSIAAGAVHPALRQTQPEKPSPGGRSGGAGGGATY